jgi:hypothetical protein
MPTSEALQTNDPTEELLARNGTVKGGFGRSMFGVGVFGETFGYENTKEALQTNNPTEEALATN